MWGKKIIYKYNINLNTLKFQINPIIFYYLQGGINFNRQNSILMN